MALAVELSFSRINYVKHYRNPTYRNRYIYNKAYFSGDFFYIFEKLNNQCKVDIIFIKSFYLNGNMEFYVTI